MIESLSVVFPVFNEEDYIKKTVTKTLEVIKDITNNYEIIIVNDASTDSSGEIAEGLLKQNPCIKAVHHKKNRKLGGSLKTGFKLASKKFVLYSDIDMPFDLEEIKRAVNILFEEKADFVSAYRINRKDEGLKRYIYSMAYNAFIKVLFGLGVRDINFSFKLIRSDLLKKLDLRSEGSFIDAEMLIKARRNRAKIAQFGTSYYPRQNGSSRLSSLSVILKFFQETIAFRFGFLKDGYEVNRR